MKPATAADGNAELTSCLTLVVPGSMSEADRAEWLRVARSTLSGIPADLLQQGCAAARKRARFVGDIVPFIFDAVGETWEMRKRNAEREQIRTECRERNEPEPEYIKAEEMRELISRMIKNPFMDLDAE
jgi:hypothetical protein